MDVRVINELVHKQSAFVEKLNAEVSKVIKATMKDYARTMKKLA